MHPTGETLREKAWESKLDTALGASMRKQAGCEHKSGSRVFIKEETLELSVE